MKALVSSISIIFLYLFISNPSFAQLQIDHQFGMKINIPADWSKNSYKDGTDQVYEFYNAEGTVAITLRAFSADASLSMDMLVQVFEQAMIPQGAERKLLEDHTSYNGIPGKQAVYQINEQGTLVNIMCFYAIQNGNAYILTGIIPDQLMAQNETQIKPITQSFSINGFEKEPQQTNAKVLPKPPGQNTGVRPTQNNSGSRPNSSPTASSSDDISGKYNFVSRSDGKVMTNYHYIVIYKNGTYEESYEPKHSPGYKGGHKGSWKRDWKNLSLIHEGNNYSDSYRIEGNELHRTANGITFIFRR